MYSFIEASVNLVVRGLIKRKQHHYNAWKTKPLHGQLIREIDGCIDISQQ